MKEEVYIGIIVLAILIPTVMAVFYVAGRFFFTGALTAWIQFERKAKQIQMEETGNGDEEK